MTSTLRHGLACFCFLVGVLILPACSAAGIAQATPTPAPVKLKMRSSAFLSSAPLFIAQEEGYFTAQGIEIEDVTLNNPGDGIAPLVQGQLDVLAGTISTGFYNAVARGGHIKIVADKGYLGATQCTIHAIMARRVLVEKNGLDIADELKGLKISTTPNTFGSYAVEKFLNPMGLKIEDMQVVSVQDAALSDAFEKGTIDLATTAEPTVTRLVHSKAAVILKGSEQLIPDFQQGYVLFGPNLLEKQPDVGRRFMVAYFKALQQYSQGKTERNVQILAKYTQLDPQTIRDACWTPIHADGQINLSSVLDFQNWSLGKKLLDTTVTDSSKLWDPSFVQYASKAVKP
ncbi:MAG: hypothetical protein EXR62_10200 [Chloroflexi bacterium]|nr:hypothetical protein [Chloroflexota bacterium]